MDTLDNLFKKGNGVYHMNMKNTQDEFQDLVLNEFRSLGEALQEFASNVDKRFDRLEARVEALENDVSEVKRAMVTKDYLDGRLRAVEITR